jgi:hypothetical protein
MSGEAELLERVAGELAHLDFKSAAKTNAGLNRAWVALRDQHLAVLRRELLALLKAGQACRDVCHSVDERLRREREYDAALKGAGEK